MNKRVLYIWVYPLLAVAISLLLIYFFILKPQTEKIEPPKDTLEISLETYETEKGWGYDIFMGDKNYIHQEVIPDSVSSKGFQSEEDARKIGEFLVYQMRNGIYPPEISGKQIDSLLSNKNKILRKPL